IDDYMREVIHTEILGYGNEREARSPHDCRRTYASLEYLSGTPINVIKEQMGHSNVGQTWDYIKNVVEASERRNQLRGAQLIFEEAKPQESQKFAVNAV
nr:tyrosine-type recombinase/integrase [Lachnospiraceae bacterium]